jgi:plastocyanin
MRAAAPRRGSSRAVTLLLFGAVFLGAQPLVAALAAGPQAVSQRGRAFSRATVEIGRGETLRFLNEDDFPHQILVSGNTVLVDSDLQSPGEVLDVAFPDSGVFAVQCGIHPRMRMSVRVR